MAMQQPGAEDAIPDIVGRRGWGNPRWPLLAALSIGPFVIVGYLLELLFAGRDCNMGAFCNLDLLPGWLQIIIIWAIFGLLWLCWLPYGVGHLEGTANPPGVAGFLRRVSEVESARWLFVGLGVLALLCIILATAVQRIMPVSFALGMIIVFVALCALIWRPEEANEQPSTASDLQRQQARQSGSYLYILRNLFPFRYLFRSRAPQVPGAAANPPPAGAGAANPPPGAAANPPPAGAGAANPPPPAAGNPPPAGAGAANPPPPTLGL